MNEHILNDKGKIFWCHTIQGSEMIVNHQENHLLYIWMFGCRDGIKAARWTACHSLLPICCCAYSLLFHPSNNGRRMRENASVSMAQPLRFHYYNHKSFQYPHLSLLLPSSPSLSAPCSHTQPAFWWQNSKRTQLKVLTLTSSWKITIYHVGAHTPLPRGSSSSCHFREWEKIFAPICTRNCLF